MKVQKVATALALLLAWQQDYAANGQAIGDPLARLHAGSDQWTAGQSPWAAGPTAVVPASYTTAPVLTSPPQNVLPRPAETWPSPGDGTHSVAYGPPVVQGHVVEPLCACESIYRTEAWQFGVELLPTVSYVTVAEFGEWPDEMGTAVRLIFGHEDPRGLGTRLRWWSFGDTAVTPARDVELTAIAFHWDFYKRLFLEDAEVVIGAGPATGELSFELSNSTESTFSGGGITAFAEAWYPGRRYEKTDIGMLIRGRITLLSGNWIDDTGFVIPETNDDSMSILELAWGVEVRRRFGQCQDKYWYFRFLIEHQNWDSAWMNVFSGTSVGFGGINISSGVAW